MAEYVIKWNQGTKDWETSECHAKMYTHGSAEIRVELVQASVLPDGIVDVTKDDLQSTEKVLVLTLELKAEAKKDPDLLSKIQNPLELSVECKPASEFSATAAAILDNQTFIRKAPVRVEAPFPTVTVVSPVDPIPGDGQAHEVTLEFKTSNGTPVGGVDVSWELVLGQPTPGGQVDPPSATLPKDGDGKATFKYTPPKISYVPKRVYEQPLKVSWSPGGQKAEITTLDLSVNPGLDATIDGKKLGFTFKDPFHLEVPAGNTPQDINVHLGFDSATRDVTKWEVAGSVSESWRLNDFGTKSVISVSADGGTNQIQLTDKDLTNAEGLFLWKLPELEKGLAKSDSFRHMTLRPFEQCPTCDFNEEEIRTLDRYYAYVKNDDVTKVLTRLLPVDIRHQLYNQSSTMAKHLAEWPETDALKARLGCDLANASVRGTVTVDQIHRKLFDDGLDVISRLFWDLIDAIIKFGKLGDLMVKKLGQAATATSKWLEGGWIEWAAKGLLSGITASLSALRSLVAQYAPDVLGLVDDLLDALSGGFSALPEKLQNFIAGITAKLASALETLVDVIIAIVVGILNASTEGSEEEAAGLGSYGKKKSAEKAVKELGKWLQKQIQGGLKSKSAASTYQGFKDSIRENIPGELGMEHVATTAVGKVTAAILAGTHPVNESASVDYQMKINQLDALRVKVENAIGGAEVVLYMLSLLCDLLALGFVIAAIFSGAATVGIKEILSNMSTMKLAVNGISHSAEGFVLLGQSYKVVDRYEHLTEGLVATP
ncbi:MAG: hypothetical protein QOH64_1826 [Acidimicrobiaceae bacterium]